jgi:hypothetical protein
MHQAALLHRVRTPLAYCWAGAPELARNRFASFLSLYLSWGQEILAQSRGPRALRVPDNDA